MKKLIKGSKAAKEYMAKIRAKRKKSKIGAYKIVESNESKQTKPAKSLKLTRRSDGTFKKFTKISGNTHKDTKSHNVKINVLSGEISKGKQKLIDNLTYLYGKYAGEYITTNNLKDKKNIYKQMAVIKKEISKLKK